MPKVARIAGREFRAGKFGEEIVFDLELNSDNGFRDKINELMEKSMRFKLYHKPEYDWLDTLETWDNAVDAIKAAKDRAIQFGKRAGPTRIVLVALISSQMNIVTFDRMGKLIQYNYAYKEQVYQVETDFNEIAKEVKSDCPDCKGTKQYIPLIGPPEPCQTCCKD